MKRIIYQAICFMSEYDPETKEVVQREVLCTENIPYSTENEERIKVEAYNGEYTIEDDGVEEVVEPIAQDDTDAMLIDHEYRLTLLELGITE